MERWRGGSKLVPEDGPVINEFTLKTDNAFYLVKVDTVAGRWVGSCRRELLDQIIPLNERHLKRVLSEFISYYYHDDRTHPGPA